MVFSSARSRVLDGADDAPERDRSIWLVLQRLRLDTAQDCRAALLIFVRVRFLSHQVFVASATMRHQSGQVALGSGGEEQGALESEPFGHACLQAIDGRIVAIYIVAHLGGRHGRAHRGRRPGHGVATQVDGVGAELRVALGISGCLHLRSVRPPGWLRPP
jgi:hypothetical protein